jgi:hypothetical protein
MAWTILSATQKVCYHYLCSSHNTKIWLLSKVVLVQKARDKSINHLIETMADVYSFVQEGESLKKTQSHKQILLHIVQQTVECGYFIRDYARNNNFGMFFVWIVSDHGISRYHSLLGTWVLKNLISDVDDKIKQYETKFGELKLAFQGHAAIHTKITVLCVLNEVESIGEQVGA